MTQRVPSRDKFGAASRVENRHSNPMSDPRTTLPTMQSEQARQRRRERKRLEREEKKMRSKKAQMCAGDELDFLLSRRVAALFTRAIRSARKDARSALRAPPTNPEEDDFPFNEATRAALPQAGEATAYSCQGI